MKSRLPQGYGGGAANLNQLAQKAQKIQEDVERITSELEDKRYTASVGGNAVSVTVNGKNEIVSIDIKPEVVDPEDVETMTDLIIAASNEAMRQASSEKEQKLSAATGGFNMPGLF